MHRTDCLVNSSLRPRVAIEWNVYKCLVRKNLVVYVVQGHRLSRPLRPVGDAVVVASSAIYFMILS